VSEAADGPVDVVVVGAGIVGLTCARALARTGARVLVLEAEDRLGRGVTGQSTAKVTVGHGTTLSSIRRGSGDERAGEYLAAAQAGLDLVESIAGESPWTSSCSHDLISSDPAAQDELAAYADDVRALGGSVEIVQDEARDHGTALVVRHGAQLLIDPVAHLGALASDLLAAGGRLELGRTVVGVEPGERVEVVCEDGWRVEASDVVLATHVPALLRTLAFAAVEQRRHYALAGVVPELPPTSYDVSAGWSTRPIHGRTEPWAVAVGGGHPTGTGNPTASLHSLRVWAEQHLHMDVRHSWSTQDAFSTDLLPLVGRTPLRGQGVWFATGFGAWGLTLGSAAGHDLAAQIGGADAAWPGWSPRRASLLTRPTLALHVGARTLGNLATQPFSRASGALAPGQGEVRRVDGTHVAVSMDADGIEWCVSARCTHLGCLVAWNAEAVSWDCPCHGSRFAADGRVLHGPATQPLEKRTAGAPPTEGAASSSP
jgi:glycine/D-amino acid oxidase-like deaminating enzyme/nitrite reductase/ring-hydroxylating ferredoxin subunit